MKETDFQALYSDYHGTLPESKEREEILQGLHHYVYQYAIKRFRANDDMASDFYMKMYDRIEKFFHDYDSKRGISFAIYLAVILKRNYLKFFLSTTQKENRYQDFVHQNPEIPWDPPATDNNGEEEIEERASIEKLVLEAIGFLELNKQMTLRLYFGFYLLLSHLRKLLNVHGNLKFFPLYRKYVQKMKAWSVNEVMARKEILEKAEKEYFRYQQDTNNMKSDKRRDHLIEDFYKIKTPVSLNFISQLMKKSTSQIHRLIKSAKQELKKIFHERYQEILKTLGISQTKS